MDGRKQESKDEDKILLKQFRIVYFYVGRDLKMTLMEIHPDTRNFFHM